MAALFGAASRIEIVAVLERPLHAYGRQELALKLLHGIGLCVGLIDGGEDDRVAVLAGDDRIVHGGGNEPAVGEGVGEADRVVTDDLPVGRPVGGEIGFRKADRCARRRKAAHAPAPHPCGCSRPH